MKKQSCFVSLLMLLLLFPLGAFAQQQMIKGQVVDDSGTLHRYRFSGTV